MPKLTNPHLRVLQLADFTTDELSQVATMERLVQHLVVERGRAIQLGHPTSGIYIAYGVAAAGDVVGDLELMRTNPSTRQTNKLLSAPCSLLDLGATDPRLEYKYLPQKGQILLPDDRLEIRLVDVATEIIVLANSAMRIAVTEYDYE